MAHPYDSAEREAVGRRFDQAAKVFDAFCPTGLLRLPAPRHEQVIVEMDLDSFETLMFELRR